MKIEHDEYKADKNDERKEDRGAGSTIVVEASLVPSNFSCRCETPKLVATLLQNWFEQSGLFGRKANTIAQEERNFPKISIVVIVYKMLECILKKPAGGKWSNPLDWNPTQSGLSRCTSLTCKVQVTIVSQSISAETTNARWWSQAAAPPSLALLEMFQLSWGQGITWNVETREFFEKPKKLKSQR